MAMSTKDLKQKATKAAPRKEASEPQVDVRDLANRLAAVEAWMLEEKGVTAKIKQRDLPLKFTADYASATHSYRKGQRYMVPFEVAQMAVDAGAATFEEVRI